MAKSMTPIPPKVSICIPTYNTPAEYLRASIQSALNQTYPSVEVIVSENHSTNDAVQVIAEFAGNPRLKVVRPPQHVDMEANFEFAGLQATGEYLSFMGADDVLHPDCFARLLPIIEAHPKLAFAYCNIQIIDQAGKVLQSVRSSHPSFIHSGLKELQRYVRSGDPRWVIGALIRRSAYVTAGGWQQGLGLASDWYLAIRLATVGDIAYHDEVLASNRVWLNEKRYRHILTHVRATCQLYERISTSNIIQLIEGGQKTIQRARRHWATLAAMSLPRHQLSKTDLDQLVTEIQRLDSSAQTQLLLWLFQTPLAPVLAGLASLENGLRLWAVQQVYHLRAIRAVRSAKPGVT